MQDWESMIASRMRPCATMPKEEDASRRAKKMSTDRYEQSEKRKVSRKKWQQSEAGKKSMHDRGKRYRATEKGRLNSLKKSRAYFDRHKDDPAWREHRRQVQKAWKQRKREEKEKQA